jgi:oligopeptide/dipeptide ABC transporter ATP-binding protein
VLVKVNNLSISFSLDGRISTPVRGVSFSIPYNARIAIVGESGSGKSLTSMSLGSLLERAEIKGEISRKGTISYIFQNPMQSLNPVMKVKRQILETAVDKNEIEHLIESVGLGREVLNKYPCQLSGGQCQRVMIAMALSRHPDLLVADEPTTALDVTTQKEVLNLIDSLAKSRKMSVLLITHNLGLVADYSDFVYVMYAGQFVEYGKVERVLKTPYHPYTKALLQSVPRLNAPKDAPLIGIPGVVPPAWAWPEGCAFKNRCPYASEFSC